MIDLPEAPKPMQIGTAIEVMKILTPHTEALKEARHGISLIGILVGEFKKTDTTENILRILSLVYKMPVDEIVKLLGGASGEDVTTMLSNGFAVNSIPDLVNASFVLRLSETGWHDAN